MKNADEALAEIRSALASWDVRFDIVRSFSLGDAVQVEARPNGRWKKVGPLLFPPDGGSLNDTLSMLADMRAEEWATPAEVSL